MTVIVRYAEIGIKGKNRGQFERCLVENIKACLSAAKIQHKGITRPYGRILIETENSCTCLKRVFGIASFSTAMCAGTTIDEAASAAAPLLKGLTEKDSFRITCQRTDKKFRLTSQQICTELGTRLSKLTKAKVKMQKPTREIMLEIISGRIYVITGRTEGPGGLPVATQGRAAAIIEDKLSVLAALLVLRRGCTILPVLVNDVDISLLQKLAYPHAKEPVKAASAAEISAETVVVNDTLDTTRQLKPGILVLRPLCGLTKEEIANVQNSFEKLLQQ